MEIFNLILLLCLSIFLTYFIYYTHVVMYDIEVVFNDIKKGVQTAESDIKKVF